MTEERAKTLINSMIDRIIDMNGGKITETISDLIDCGFTKEEMMMFSFHANEIDEIIEAGA